MSYQMNYKGVCRTIAATEGLLIMEAVCTGLKYISPKYAKDYRLDSSTTTSKLHKVLYKT